MMDIENIFNDFFNKIKFSNFEDIDKKIRRITKKLNSIYYNSDSETEHLTIVGSLGRGTAINNISDLDIIFDLPKYIYTRYDNYLGNGQSTLLQEIKSVIKQTYPNTQIKGDGQVVCVNMEKIDIEILPAFKNNDGSFKYPDTNNGGSWKKTNPLMEIEASKEMNSKTNGDYVKLCNMIRIWKNNNGVNMSGLLIDHFCYNFLKENKNKYKNYLELLLYFFVELKTKDKTQSYWLSFGSNQQITNKDNGRFVNKAEKTFKILSHIYLSDITLNEKINQLIVIFGNIFPKKILTENIQIQYINTEEFIENKYIVDIEYNLKIDCKVTQDGFRECLLSKLKILKHKKKLLFFIQQNEVSQPYKVLWKVRNYGYEAEKRKMIRGQIEEDLGKEEKKENSSFNGNHYVECYIIKNDKCVAMDRIDVIINDE